MSSDPSPSTISRPRPETDHAPAPAASGLLAEAWRAAAAIRDDIVDVFDTPAELARHEYMRCAGVRQLHAWLRALAALVQRLVLLRALALNLKPPPLRPRRPRVVVPRDLRRVGLRTSFLKWPETWDVRLPGVLGGDPRGARLSPEAGPPGPRRPPKARRPHIPLADRLPPPSVLPLWGAAARLEALRRLIAEPDRAARRLAFAIARRRERAPSLPLRPAVLDRWRPPADPDAAPYLAVRLYPDLQTRCEDGLAAFSRARPERFPTKWMPVRRKKTRPNRRLEPG
jgi:hypothetical protein